MLTQEKVDSILGQYYLSEPIYTLDTFFDFLDEKDYLYEFFREKFDDNTSVFHFDISPENFQGSFIADIYLDNIDNSIYDIWGYLE